MQFVKQVRRVLILLFLRPALRCKFMKQTERKKEQYICWAILLLSPWSSALSMDFYLCPSIISVHIRCFRVLLFLLLFAKMMTIRYGISFVLWLKVHILLLSKTIAQTNKISCKLRSQAIQSCHKNKISSKMRESVRKDTFKHCRFRCIQFLNVYYDLPGGERDDANLFLLRSSFNFTHAKRMKTREKKSFEMVRTKDHDRWRAFLIIYYSSSVVFFIARCFFLFRVLFNASWRNGIWCFFCGSLFFFQKWQSDQSHA